MSALVELLDRFHITDKAIVRARKRAHERGDAESVARLAAEAHRYFASMERESDEQLRELDRRLDDLYQRQYNLHAERSVMLRRRDGARAALDTLAQVDGNGAAL